MKTESVWLLAQDGARLHMRVHEPDSAPLGCVTMVHGMGEHAGRYERVAQAFCRCGYVFIVHDQRGHGRTPGKRGVAPSYEVLVDDIDLVLGWVDTAFPGLPTCLYGHSLGGNLVLHRLSKGGLPHNIRCAVAGSPWLTLHAPPTALKVALARLVTKVAPDFSKKSTLKIDDLTRSEVVRAETRADSLYHFDIGALFFMEIVAAGQTLLANASRFEPGVPLFVMVGTSDRVVSHESVLAFAERCGDRCESKVWHGLYHELHNEPEADEVLGTVADFLARLLRFPSRGEV